jgi:crossover junction endodeoxyribonuclease RusA
MSAEADTVTLSLPWPPSVNRFWRPIVVGGRRRTLLNKEGRAYRHCAVAAVLAHGMGRPGLEGPRSVHLLAHPPNRL